MTMDMLKLAQARPFTPDRAECHASRATLLIHGLSAYMYPGSLRASACVTLLRMFSVVFSEFRVSAEVSIMYSLKVVIWMITGFADNKDNALKMALKRQLTLY